MIFYQAATGDSVGVSPSTPLPVSDSTLVGLLGGVTLTDKSSPGAITSGGNAQQLMGANASRKGARIQNQSGGTLYISSVAAAVIGSPSEAIPPGMTWEYPLGGCPVTAISIIGATTGQAFAAREW